MDNANALNTWNTLSSLHMVISYLQIYVNILHKYKYSGFSASVICTSTHNAGIILLA
jgi:hypothetical protein